MDERKRTYDADEESIGQLKRLRPEEILGTTGGEPNAVVTRIIVNKLMFSKIIGKGGQSIANLRSTSGAYIKGTNIDEEQRLVVISGGISHVIAAFDMILHLVFSHGAASFAEFMRHGIVSLETHTSVLLVEHGKVGRVVGQKGSTLQALKQKSGAVVRVEKFPVEYAGVSLRNVSLEGSVASIQRAHAAILELFVDQVPASQASAHGSLASVLSVPSRGGYPGFPVAYPMLPPQGFIAPAGTPYGYSGSTAVTMSQPSGFLAMSDAFGQSLPTAASRAQVQQQYARPNPAFSQQQQQQQGYSYSMPHQQQQSLPATRHQRNSQQLQPQIKEVDEASRQKSVGSVQPLSSQQIAPGTAITTPAASAESSLPNASPADASSALALTSAIGDSPLVVGERPGRITPLSAAVLLGAGVPPSAVDQLVNLQSYLLRSFGLELAVASVSESGGRNGTAVGDSAVLTAEQVLAQRDLTSPFQLCFAVPSSCVGGIIGKGGKLLRALQAEFGVRVYVEKEEYMGQRIVCLTYTGCVQSDATSTSQPCLEPQAEEETERLQQDSAGNTDSTGLQRDIEVELDFDQLRTGDRETGEAAAAVTGEEESRTRRSDDLTEGPPLKKRSTSEDRAEERLRADSVPEAPTLTKVRGRSREDPADGCSPLAGQGSAVKRNRRDDTQEEDDQRDAEANLLVATPSAAVPSLSKKRETRDSADSLEEASELNGSTRKASKLARGAGHEMLEGQQQEARECSEAEGESDLESTSLEASSRQLSTIVQQVEVAEDKEVAVARLALQRCRERIEVVMEDVLQRLQGRDAQDQAL